jgi:methylation protein EvaC
MIASTQDCRTDRCRACASAYDPRSVLELGARPLGNLAPPGRPIDPRAFPLEFVVCSGCGLVQNRCTLPADQVNAQFRYFTSGSTGISQRCNELAEGFVARGVVARDGRVVEIGSNEGLLLKRLAELGPRVLGFEPVEEVAALATGRHGVPTICDVFGRRQGEGIARRNERPDLIIAMDVLMLVSDANDVLAGVYEALKPGGTVFIEVPDVVQVVANGRIDAFAHDRMFWFTVETLCTLLERHGLHAYDAEQVDVRGGSLNVHASPTRRDPSSRLRELRQAARRWRRDVHGRFQAFHRLASDCLRRQARQIVERADRGGRIAAYGAGIKGALLLSLLGDAADRVAYVVDANPAKAGCRMPGTDLPVVGPDRLAEDPVDALLLLALDHRAEIEGQFGRDLEIIVPVGDRARSQPDAAD